MENLIFEKSVKGRFSRYVQDPGIALDRADKLISSQYLRKDLPLPSLGELDVVRHYTRLSSLNYGVDTNFYPLGSCTMKYNPKINEQTAALPGFISSHPLQDESDLQGCLALIYDLEKMLAEITGMPYFTFQPCAGAQGEFTGMMIVRAWHEHKKQPRSKVIVPDSSHGTNPASAAMCGYKVEMVESNSRGLVDIDKLAEKIDRDTAAVMLTNPNTLGLFETGIMDLAELAHKKGALLYYDGANFNALLGKTHPGKMGFDVLHLNLHKTFSTPHGGGGPGSGAVGVSKKLRSFLPVPVIEKKGKKYRLKTDLRHSIGKVHAFYGNFSVLVKTYAYLLRLGREGLSRASENAVLNARYLEKMLQDVLIPASNEPCMHETVFSALNFKQQGLHALDIAKRLIDYGIHPPTMYFPLIVKEALMIEPTETESKETLDRFVSVMKKIKQEAELDPELLKTAPHNTELKRLDEVKAARFPDLRWKKTGE